MLTHIRKIIENIFVLFVLISIKLFEIGLCKLIIFIGFVYQFQLLTRDYSKFEFNVQVLAKFKPYVPSLTFCFNQSYLDDNLNFNVTTLDDIFYKCDFKIGDGTTHNCHLKSYYLSFKSNTTKYNICFTLLNDNNKERQIIVKYYHELHLHVMKKLLNLQIQIHHYHIPVFFSYTEPLIIKAGQLLGLDVRLIIHELLPRPYSTDCVDYMSGYSFNLNWTFFLKSTNEHFFI